MTPTTPTSSPEKNPLAPSQSSPELTNFLNMIGSTRAEINTKTTKLATQWENTAVSEANSTPNTNNPHQKAA